MARGDQPIEQCDLLSTGFGPVAIEPRAADGSGGPAAAADPRACCSRGSGGHCGGGRADDYPRGLQEPEERAHCFI